jgi:hypothetical protein
VYVQIVVACCFLNGATAEEREGKQIFLPAVPPYPFYFYANNPVAPVYVNAGEAPFEMDARVQSKSLSRAVPTSWISNLKDVNFNFSTWA